MKHSNVEQEIKEVLSNWKTMIASYQIPDNKKAVLQLVTTFLPFIGLWALMYLSLSWSIWITCGLGLINAFFLVKIFIVQHDCGHQSFFNSKKWNTWVGIICSFFSTIPFRYWAKVHNFHHGHNGQLEVREIGDIPMLTVKEYKARKWFGKLKYRIWRMPLVTFGIAPVYYLIISNRLPLYTKQMRSIKSVIINQLKNNVSIVLLYGLLAYLLGWKQFLFIQFFLVFTFGIIAFWFFYVQHQHERSYKQWRENWDYLLSAIKGSTYYKLPRVFQWLTGNIGLHHIHHLSSLIPNYNLEKCMRENQILNKYVTIISFWQSLKLIKNKLWDEDEGKMVSFREATKLVELRAKRLAA